MAFFSGIHQYWGDLAPSIPPRPHLGRGCLFLLNPDCLFLYDGRFQPAIAAINVPLLGLGPLQLALATTQTTLPHPWHCNKP